RGCDDGRGAPEDRTGYPGLPLRAAVLHRGALTLQGAGRPVGPAARARRRRAAPEGRHLARCDGAGAGSRSPRWGHATTDDPVYPRPSAREAMPRILILHASVGTGHLSAARALDAAFRRTPGVEVRTEDTLDFGSRAVAEAIVRGYLRLSSRAPSVWKALYEATDLDDPRAMLAANVRRGRLGRPLFGRLLRLVRDYAPDAIVCT